MNNTEIVNLNMEKKQKNQILKYLKENLNDSITGISIYKVLFEDDPDKENLGITLFKVRSHMKSYKIKVKKIKGNYSLTDVNSGIDYVDNDLSKVLNDVIQKGDIIKKNSNGKQLVDIIKDVIKRFDDDGIKKIPISVIKDLVM